MKRIHLALAAIAIAGLAARLIGYLYGKSLWFDEASVAVNIMDRSYGQLLQRLDYFIVNPPLFLIISKAVYSLWGHIEYSFRFLPFVAGCLSLLVFIRTVKRIMPSIFGICAAALYSLNVTHINWATSAKHYSLEELSSAVAILIAVEWTKLSTRWRCVIALVLPVLLWFSFTFAFVITGFIVALAYSFLKERKASASAPLIVLIAATSASALWLYMAAIRYSLGYETLVGMWSDVDAFPTAPYSSWLGKSLLAVVGYACGVPYGPLLVMFFCLIGGYALWRDRYQSIVIISAVTLLTALGAAALGVYPFMSGRLSTYWSPMVLLLFASGLQAVWHSLGNLRFRRFITTLAICIVLINIIGSLSFASFIFLKEEMRYVTEHLGEQYDGETPILVSSLARRPFRIYGGKLPSDKVVHI
ncbi:MAG: glycosyltransferase family 39 protein, partial [Candidatus Coatesbacteria bacterium]|nr:glycosyltransferase family 39 protein [Candidatus Coatesbacteria bacterium]